MYSALSKSILHCRSDSLEYISRFGFDFRHGECGLYSPSRTHTKTFTACLAESRIYICKVISDRNRREGASAGTFATTDTRRRAHFSRNSSTLTIRTGDPYSTVASSSRADFKQVARAFAYARTAGSTLLRVNDGKHCRFIYCNCPEFTYCCTIAATETPECTSTGAYRNGIHHRA